MGHTDRDIVNKLQEMGLRIISQHGNCIVCKPIGEAIGEVLIPIDIKFISTPECTYYYIFI